MVSKLDIGLLESAISYGEETQKTISTILNERNTYFSSSFTEKLKGKKVNYPGKHIGIIKEVYLSLEESGIYTYAVVEWIDKKPFLFQTDCIDLNNLTLV